MVHEHVRFALWCVSVRCAAKQAAGILSPSRIAPQTSGIGQRHSRFSGTQNLMLILWVVGVFWANVVASAPGNQFAAKSTQRENLSSYRRTK